MTSAGSGAESGGPATLNMMYSATEDLFVSKDTSQSWSALTNKSVLLQHVGSLPWETPLDLITFEFQKTFEKFVFGVILPVLFLISTPTNCLNMIVFYKQGLKERIHLCLFSLSAVQLTHMTQAFLFKLDFIYFLIIKTPATTSFSILSIKLKFAFLNGLAWLSAFTITIIACERCLCIVSPLHARHFIKTKTTAFMLFFSSLMSLGGFYVISMKWTAGNIFDPLTNTTIPREILSKEYIEYKDIIDVFEGTIFGLIVPGFCVTVVSVTTVVTIFKLQRMATWRDRSLTSSSDLMSSRDIALMRTLVFICIMFVSCYTPVVVYHNAVRVYPELRLGGRLEYSYRLLANISQLCIFINSSFSFFRLLQHGL